MKKVKMLISFLLFLLFTSIQVKAGILLKRKIFLCIKRCRIWEREQQNLVLLQV